MADSSHGMVIAIAVVFTALALVIVGLRARARSIKGPLFTADDYLIFASAFFFVLCITVPTLVLAVNSHLGDHMVLGPGGQPEPPTYAFNLTLLIFQTVHVVPITLVKLSFLFFYRRIFRGPIFNIVSWATIALASVWGIAFFFSILAQCTPIDLSLVLPSAAPQLHCIDETANFWGLSISDVLIDIIIFCIPFPFVWNLQMSTKHKWGVSGMFFLGALTIAASIARLAVFINAGKLLAENDPDFTFYVAPTAYVVLIECSLAITSACLPVLRPLLSAASFESAVRYIQNAFSLPSNSSRRPFARSSAASRSRSRSAAAEARKGAIKLDSSKASSSREREQAWISLDRAEKGRVNAMDREVRPEAGQKGWKQPEGRYVAEVGVGADARDNSLGRGDVQVPRGIRVQSEWRADSRQGRL